MVDTSAPRTIGGIHPASLQVWGASRAWVVGLSILAFCGLTALAAQARIPIPGSPVPMTLQVLAVLLGGYLLKASTAAAAMMLYLVLGSAGVPVFSPGSAGIWGPTGGYLVAFPLAAGMVAKLSGPLGAGWVRRAIAGLLGISVIVAMGWVWLAAWGGSWEGAARWGVWPFLPKAMIEGLLALHLAAGCKHWFRARNGIRHGI